MNVAAHLSTSAQARGDHAAIIEPSGTRSWRVTSFRELDQRCDALAHGLIERGIAPGDRVALFVRPGLDLIAITFALFKTGAIPILIDPGMGRANVVSCLERTRPRVLIGVWQSQVLLRLYARRLSSIAIGIQVGSLALPGLETLNHIARPSRGAFRPCAPLDSRPAAILFTSGSTGPPKGVEYTHALFNAQIALLRELYAFAPGERDLACFPLFALFDAALQTTAVIPRLDPMRPAECDPSAIADALLAHGCTYGFGSPAIWKRVVPWALANGTRFPTLTRALIAGAPVSPSLIADLATLIAPGGDAHTPYGATECLPVSSICGAEFAGGVRALVEGGHGSCVGRPAPGLNVAIVPVSDAPLEHVAPLAPGTIGEICVRGPVVTRAYADDAAATRRAKIIDGDTCWHRMGDAGYFDGSGRLWTVGRLAHRIETRGGSVWPVPLENVCDLHPAVARTALVADGTREPCLVVEPHARSPRRSSPARAALLSEMRALVAAKRMPGAPAELDFPSRLIECRAFPVDVRHNAKIRREELALLAAEDAP
ncbi:MAG: AMP-binding protein [Planctomycetes bacterium]|nr:AMP-binding protein [Planctomycetota bacterium]